MTSDLINLIANIALALSFIVGLVFGIVQVRAAARDRRERLTLDSLHHFQSREFVELFHRITSMKLPVNRDGMRALPEADKIMIIQYAQEMESLGILMAERFIDIGLVDKTIGSLVTTTWDKYKTLYIDLRMVQPDPFLGEYFQWLAEHLDKRMREHPRKPFYETHPHGDGVRHG